LVYATLVFGYAPLTKTKAGHHELWLIIVIPSHSSSSSHGQAQGSTQAGGGQTGLHFGLQTGSQTGLHTGFGGGQHLLHPHFFFHNYTKLDQ